MHAIARRTGSVAATLAVALGAVVVSVSAASPATAAPRGDGCGTSRCDHSGGATGSGYSAAAALASATGGGDNPTTVQCEVNHEVAPAGTMGHIEAHVYGPGPSYNVFIDCVENGYQGTPGPPAHWDVREIYSVVAMPPELMLEEALAALQVPAPVITTSPGGANAGLVEVETFLSIDPTSWQPVGPITDVQGPLSVEVWATPNTNGEVIWETGEGRETCIGSGQPLGSCGHTYHRSSARQAGRDALGRPAFGITASVSYSGGYEVFVYGTSVARVDIPGNVIRTSAPHFLAVDEAQAINKED